MKTFSNLKNGDKVIDTYDGMVMTYYKDDDGKEYLTNDRWAWDLYQFDPKDFKFKRYNKSKEE